MFTRVVEITSKSGKARELCNTIDDKVLPILNRQAGFVDETVIVSDTEPNRILALSFWNTREDAQRYEREQFDAGRSVRRTRAGTNATSRASSTTPQRSSPTPITPVSSR